jgi:hypothetical protein
MSTAKAKAHETAAARQKRVWDKAAHSYDRQIAFFEKFRFAGGQESLGKQARGRGTLHPPAVAPGQGGRVSDRGDRTTQGRHRGADPRGQAHLSRPQR